MLSPSSTGGHVVICRRALELPPATLHALDGLPRTVYFDTETTGLSTGAGTVIFLAGLARREGANLVVTQYLLPDYPHEHALLAVVVEGLMASDRLVSYNGRSFDIPILLSRLALHQRAIADAVRRVPHDDLLSPARRLWRRRLGSARLAAVELGVLGIRRTSDCPSAEVPGRYLSYVRGASPSVLSAVLDHNAQDVVSLALLDARIVELTDGAWRTAPEVDPRGMALELLRRGRRDEAVELLDRAAAEAVDELGALPVRRLAARLLVAAGDPDRAEQLWRSATRRASVAAATAWIEIAAVRERHRRDLRGALDAATAAARVLDLALALGRGGTISEIGRARLRVDARLRRLRGRVRASERTTRTTRTRRGAPREPAPHRRAPPAPA